MKNPKHITRRDFMVGGAAVAGAALGVMTLGSGILTPALSRAAGAESGEGPGPIQNRKNPRVLVAYATCCGSTGEVAKAVGKALINHGAQADVRPVEKVTDISPYDAVVVGSAIQRSRWLPEALEFVEGNRRTLRDLPLAYFLTCLTLYQDTEKNRQKALSYLGPVLEGSPEVKPLAIGLFAGVLDYGKLSFPMRVIMKHKMKKSGVPEGDFRDWGAIRGWAGGCSGLIHGSLL
jgi:menaquinone-dependent protoporphyrinogen oxidase